MFHHQRRVDFKTRVDWNESHKLLKVAFPADLVAAKATYEIPFGALERATHNNTSWERAQFEVCGHRWADLSEGNSGISLLNDCKYGYDIKDRTIRLSYCERQNGRMYMLIKGSMNSHIRCCHMQETGVGLMSCNVRWS